MILPQENGGVKAASARQVPVGVVVARAALATSETARARALLRTAALHEADTLLDAAASYLASCLASEARLMADLDAMDRLRDECVTETAADGTVAYTWHEGVVSHDRRHAVPAHRLLRRTGGAR